MIRARTNNKKVFTYLGPDCRRKCPELLLKASREGYTILALNARAVGDATEAGVPYTVIDDWLTTDALLQVKQHATASEMKWFESVREGFTSDGICWPEFDHHAMHWFWLDTALAGSLADAFRGQGVKRLRVHLGSPLRPALYCYPSDVCSAFWKAEFPDEIEVERIVKDLPERGGNEFRVISNPPDLYSLFLDSDLVICAGGRIFYELHALGVPALAIASAWHEAPVIGAFMDKERLIKGLEGWDEKEFLRFLDSSIGRVRNEC